MDISKYWPFTEVDKIPKNYILLVDTNTLYTKGDATPKNIGKGYTFVGEYPLLASKEVFKRMKKAKDTNNPSLLPVKPIRVQNEQDSLMIQKINDELINMDSQISLEKIYLLIRERKDLFDHLKDTLGYKILQVGRITYVDLEPDEEGDILHISFKNLPFTTYDEMYKYFTSDKEYPPDKINIYLYDTPGEGEIFIHNPEKALDNIEKIKDIIRS